MYTEIFNEMKKQLGQLEKWLDAATTFAKAKSFEPNLFLQFRLAPDQFPLVRQIQSTCDSAKLGASRVSGKDAPSHPDTEQTIDELRTRIRAVISYLDGYKATDFASAATRTVSLPRWEGKSMTVPDYFVEHVVPNFYFHLAHSYAILRHNGVDIGKRDYLGALTMK